MNAKTVLSDRKKLKLLQRLEALYASACDLIFRDTRNETEIDVLLDSLQAFKHGKLRRVIVSEMDDAQRRDVLDTFSVYLEDTLSLSAESKDYLRRRGVRYIGEIYYVVFDARSPRSVAIGKSIFRELKAIYGLKRNLDPLAMGWIPPYWSTAVGTYEQYKAALDTPVLVAFGTYDSVTTEGYSGYRRGGHPARLGLARRLHARGIHFLGQYLERGRKPESARSGSAWMPGQLEDKQRVLTATRAPVWAAALIPSTWKAPEEVPGIWIEEQQKIERETAEWQSRKERKRLEEAEGQEADRLE